MKDSKKKDKVWVSAEDLIHTHLENSAQEQSEFNHTEESSEHSRRDFLKYMGFSLSAATVAASCEAPIKHAIPYVIKPEEIVPGVATYFASTIVQGGDATPALIRTREGRPIRVQGNPGTDKNPIFTAGGTHARSQAAVLDLYDTNRVVNPGVVATYLEAETLANTKQRKEKQQEGQLTWKALDSAIASGLKGRIRIVSHTNNSPTFKAAVDAFKAQYPQAEWVQYDPISSSAQIEANRLSYGVPHMPLYRLDRAKCIVGIEADFLATWLSPVEFTHGYTANRKLTDQDIDNAAEVMSTHIQIESRMSLTGSNADHRVLIKPSEWEAAVGFLYQEVAKLTGNSTASLSFAPKFAWEKAEKALKSTAKKLVEKNRQSVVVCGINDVKIQQVVNAINDMIGARGNTVVINENEHSLQRMGSDAAAKQLVADMEANRVDAVIVCGGANPAFDLPGSLAADFAKSLPQVGMSISMNATLDETSALCQYIAPDNHNLETWGDAEPRRGEIFVIQPTIGRLFNTRAAGESLLVWAKQPQSYREFMKKIWKERFFPLQNEYMIFQSFWNNTLHDGWTNLTGKVAMDTAATAVQQSTEAPVNTEVEPVETVAESNANDVSNILAGFKQEKVSGLEVTFYESIQLGAGQFANNPWLQEMPDPVMRTTWDNFLQVPLKWNGSSGYESLANLQDGDLAKINIDGVEYELPVFRTFGQMAGTVSIAVGYGRTRAGKAGTNVGTNVFPAVKNFNYSSRAEMPTHIGYDDLFACVQMHHTYGLTTVDESTGKTQMHTYPTGEEKPFNVDEANEGFQGALVERSVFFHSTAKDLKKEVEVLAKKRAGYQYLNSKGLYPEPEEYKMGHHWAMSIDLSTCTGCGACTVACMAENNIPVVGKFEVNKVHEMTWLRIDRYFYGDETTPNTVYMPMMCQHCDNAPCENVCPVAATNHSSEGLNQMTYNRCIGTRYCANNCPYKVRRFNWLDYTSADIFPSNEVDINRGVEGKEDYIYMNDNLTRMVLNPDVTVRSRGVIEKCSFCVQRLQEAKLTAKMEGRRLKDSDLHMACEKACPTGGIVFGDDNDPTSGVYKQQRTKRSYLVLEETNVRPSVNYQMKVINKDENFA